MTRVTRETLRGAVDGALDHAAARFLAAGLLTTTLAFVCFRAFLHLLGDQPRTAWAAQAGSYAISVAVSYVINRRWTFRGDGGGHGRQLPRFLTAHLGSLALSSALIQAGVSAAHLPVLACWVGAVGVTTVVNFTLQRLWVFAPPQPRPATLHADTRP